MSEPSNLTPRPLANSQPNQPTEHSPTEERVCHFYSFQSPPCIKAVSILQAVTSHPTVLVRYHGCTRVLVPSIKCHLQHGTSSGVLLVSAARANATQPALESSINQLAPAIGYPCLMVGIGYIPLLTQGAAVCKSRQGVQNEKIARRRYTHSRDCEYLPKLENSRSMDIVEIMEETEVVESSMYRVNKSKATLIKHK